VGFGDCAVVVVVVVVVVRSRVSGTAEPNLLFGSIWTFENIFISPTHKRTEGRAPVWGSEFTSKDAALQGGYSKNRCKAERKIVRSGDWWW